MGSHWNSRMAYSATIHSATRYSPRELFHSFAPPCPLDAMVTASLLEPAGSADPYALQALEWLQEAATFMRATTGKQMQRMKRYYDASVKPQSFEEGDQVLLFDPRKKQHCAKWHVSWKGPMIVKKC